MRRKTIGNCFNIHSFIITEVRINFLIEHQCPQCGAPAVLEETDRLFSCAYCRVNSYLIADDFFRYVLPHPAADNKEIIFFPYWRFKGMLFFCGPNGIVNRFVDISQQAIESPYFPFSVGIRSQAMKIRFVTPDTVGHFLKPRQSHQKIFNNFEQRFGKSLPRPITHQSQIGETLSLIYAPFYKDGKLYDAVLNKPLSTTLPESFSMRDFAEDNPRGHIHFVSTLCPNCGWDLEGERDALVLRCKNCHSTWYPVGKKLKQLKFAHVSDQGNNTIFMPFWRIKAEITGLQLNSYADLVKVANLPKAVQNDWQDIAFRFWIPAFKVRPKIFLRLASQITVVQPQKDLVPQLPDGRIHPGNLPVEEAIESLKLTLANFMKPRKSLTERLPHIKVEAEKFSLVYFPFSEEQHEYIQPEYQIAINKNVMALSKNL
jgi:predicted RNA-binding Zn-ribbon protein involved in translation (DUF1610 family)